MHNIPPVCNQYIWWFPKIHEIHLWSCSQCITVFPWYQMVLPSDVSSPVTMLSDDDDWAIVLRYTKGQTMFTTCFYIRDVYIGMAQIKE
jgi:hypothetical protein